MWNIECVKDENFPVLDWSASSIHLLLEVCRRVFNFSDKFDNKVLNFKIYLLAYT